MPMVYWALIGLVVGSLTGILVRRHTVNWGIPIDAGIGVAAGVMGAAVTRGFGIGSVGTDWRNLIAAALSSAIAVWIVNDLARHREEEVAALTYDPMAEPRLHDAVIDEVHRHKDNAA